MVDIKEHLKRVDFLLSMIHCGVRDKDKDQVRSHLEDLSGYLVQHDIMKLYSVIDTQAGYFMSDTLEEPMPLEDLRERFWGLDECRTEKFEDFTKEYIEDIWTLQIVEVN